MIDFTNCKELNKVYAGANGNKISVLFNDERYMLKFPAHPTKVDNISYTNSVISEYIGSHIFNMLGIPSQDTLLGKYKKNDKEYIVVACKDFTNAETILQDFASLKNSVIESSLSGYGTELNEVLDSIDGQNKIDPVVLKKRFWDMFIVDAFIGNWDRHNGNWGFLYNQKLDEMTLAPVYDCGSCLYPQLDIESRKNILTNKAEQNLRIYNRPISALRIDDVKINYFDFLTTTTNRDCINSLKEITAKINLNKINNLIDEIDCISDIEKEFYKLMLKNRKEKILDYSLFKQEEIEQNVEDDNGDIEI